MRFKAKKIIIFLSIPIIFILQFYLFKSGVISPQIKGVEVQAVEGKYLKDIDKYIIKLDEGVIFSMGDYIKFPQYAKDPIVEFRNLDENSILTIEDNSKQMKNTAKITGNDTGLASVAVVSNNKIMKKFNILVVDPKVTNLDIQVDKDLKYVGDVANISSVVEVDFDRFDDDKYSVNYKSSNENIIKIIENKLYAVGVGKATVTAFIDSKKQEFDYNIVAKLKSIVADNIDIEVDESKNIDAHVVTSPKNLKTPQIKYSFVDIKLPVDRKVSLENGKIIGLREGEEKILLTCGSGKNKVTKTISVTVNEISIENKKVENFVTEYYFDEDGNLMLNLKWDLIKGAKKYRVYIKNNKKNQQEYELLETIDSEKLNLNNKSANYKVKLKENKFSSFDYDIYVIGYNNRQNSQKSDIYNLKYSKNE